MSAGSHGNVRRRFHEQVGGELGFDVISAVSSRYGRRMLRLGCRRDGNVSVGDGQTVGRIETAPASPGQISFAPSVQIAFVLGNVSFPIPADESGRDSDRA